MDNLKKNMAVAAAQVTPPAGISLWLTWGNHLDDWIKLATLIYIIGQIIFLGMKAWMIAKRKWKGDEEDGLE